MSDGPPIKMVMTGAVYDFLTGAKRREWMGMGEWDDYY